MATAGFHLVMREGECVMPGDVVADVVETDDGSAPAVLRLGPGVRQEGSHVLATAAGLVRVHFGRSKIWLDFNKRRVYDASKEQKRCEAGEIPTREREVVLILTSSLTFACCGFALVSLSVLARVNISPKYVPALEDMVIGVVTDRHGEGYRVDIGAAEAAQLGNLSFEGATKRNRPYLKTGALVYARVVIADPELEPELSCIQPGSNKSWITGESLFGELTGGGQLLSVSLATARSFLRPQCHALTALGESLPDGFECVIGLNGRVWLRASTPKDTIIVRSILRMVDMGSFSDRNNLRPEINKLIRKS